MFYKTWKDKSTRTLIIEAFLKILSHFSLCFKHPFKLSITFDQTEALSEGLIPNSLELEWNILKLPDPEAGLKITC